MPTFADLMGEITAFVAAYDVLVYTAAAAGLVFWALKRFIKAGR